MAFWYFELDQIPDLSLSKYMSLEESGVDGVLKRQSSFLRQLNRKGLLSKVFFHLLYTYKPVAPRGKKLSISLIASGEREALYHTKELIQNSSISTYYNIICCENISIEKYVKDENNQEYIEVVNHLGIRKTYQLDCTVLYLGKLFDEKKKSEIWNDRLFINELFTMRVQGNHLLELNSEVYLTDEGLKQDNMEYDYCSTLGKREFFVQPSVILSDDNDLKYYRVADWEMNDAARLYSMLRLMQGLNLPVSFRVDLYPVDYAMRLREVLPIQELRNRTSMKTIRNFSSIAVNRDENAEETLKYYNDLIEKYESSPHFRMNIIAYANEMDISELIVDAAGAEALESGSYTIKTLSGQNFGGKFNIYSFIEKPIDIAQEGVINYLRFMPNLFLLEEVSAFFVFPALYDGEVVEISKETAPTFDKEGLKLAVDENGYDVIFPVDLFKKHAFLAGVPGSGKTNSMLHLASSLWKKHKIPFLIFEPAKQEYRALARTEGMEDLLVFSPSSGTFFPLHINPFEFPMGMSLSEHIRNLMAVFEGAFSLAQPAPFIIDYSIEGIYREKGWYPDTLNDGSLPYPTIQDLYDRLEIEVEKTDYEGEIKGNLKSILQVRIGSLLKREMGDVFNVSKSSIAPEEWLNQPALIELEAMGSGPANFLSLLLSTLIRETLKITPNADGKELRHVMFFEEAHNLIGPIAQEVLGEDADPKMAATAFVVKMLAEVRALREGIVIADQLPTVMAPEVIKNTGLKVGHRITAEDDRSLLGSTMAASGMQLEQMATFLPGEALITFEGLLRPFKAQICQWEEGKASYASPSNAELSEMMWNASGYRRVLSRSSNITCTKFESQLDTIHNKISSVLKANKQLDTDYIAIMNLCKENNILQEELYNDENSQNPLVVKAQDALLRIKKEKDALSTVIADVFSEIEELLVKEKSYILQNKMYQKRTVFDFVRTSELRKIFYGQIKKRYAMFESRFQYFNNEMVSWNIQEMLIDIFTINE